MSLTNGLVAAWGFNKDLSEAAGQYKDYIAGLVLTANDNADHPAASPKLGAGAYQANNTANRKLTTACPGNLWAQAGTMGIWWRGETLVSATDKIVELAPTIAAGGDLFLQRALSSLSHRVGWMFQTTITGLYTTLPARDTNWHLSIIAWSDPLYDPNSEEFTWAYKQWHDGVAGVDGAIIFTSTSPSFGPDFDDFDFILCGNASYWNGDVDAFHIWNRELSADEIAELWNGGAGWEYAPDRTPDAFAFTAVTDADPSTQYESSAAEITGMDAGTAISITGGEYSIDDGAYTSAPGTINPGQTLTLRGTSSADPEGATTVSVTVGTVTVSWTITTAAGQTQYQRFIRSPGSGIYTAFGPAMIVPGWPFSS